MFWLKCVVRCGVFDYEVVFGTGGFVVRLLVNSKGRVWWVLERVDVVDGVFI